MAKRWGKPEKENDHCVNCPHWRCGDGKHSYSRRPYCHAQGGDFCLEKAYEKEEKEKKKMICLYDGFRCPFYEDSNCKVTDPTFDCSEYWRYNFKEESEEEENVD